MSQEVLEIMKTMDWDELRTQLALQCAPLLTGLKISNLLIIPKVHVRQVYDLFRKTGISVFLAYESQEKVTFLLYQKSKLVSYLEQREVKEVMQSLGYDSLWLDVVLKEFAKRYQSYMSEGGVFPHEMGLLLGYPVKDVIGFMENQGNDFLYTGYWKVYSNLKEAVLVFEQYNRAKEMVIRMVSKGENIRTIIDKYHFQNWNENRI